MPGRRKTREYWNVRTDSVTASLREQEAPRFAKMTGEEIADATSVLQRHPLIGRPAPHNLHELVISKGRSGYVALYRFLPSRDRIEILAIRHQRECGFVD